LGYTCNLGRAKKEPRAKPACGPFRGFGIDRSGPPASPWRPILSWNWLLVQSPPPAWYREYWFRDPVSPLALAPAIRFFQPGDSASVKQTRLRLSSSSAFLQSLSRSHLVGRAAGTAARLLSWASLPFSTCWTRGSTARGLTWPARFRPQGLATLSAAYSPRGPRRPCFMPTALLGLRPSERSPLERYP